MKKILISVGILCMGIPVMADIINPNLSPEQLKELKAERQRMYVERQRFSTINRVCGKVTTNDQTLSCKKKLYEDYLETVNFLEDKYNGKQVQKEQ